MSGLPAGVVLVVFAFFLGAIPWGYVAGRVTQGIDLRAIGSGGTGATNVLRSLGGKASAVVFTLDFLKGLLPVFIARFLGFGDVWIALAAVAPVVGHCWSPFIAFKGGKGVATGAGAAIALFPQTLLALPVMAVVVWSTRYVSLASLISAVLVSALAAGFAAAGRLDWPAALAITAISVIIIVRHNANILRLRDGTERRIGERVGV